MNQDSWLGIITQLNSFTYRLVAKSKSNDENLEISTTVFVD